MAVSETAWEFMKNHLQYTDEEMQAFKENPINEVILSKAQELMNKTIVVEIVESKSSRLADFANAISVETQSSDATFLVVGTLFGNNDPRIVRVNDYHVDAIPTGVMLIVRNQDQPGMVG